MHTAPGCEHCENYIIELHDHLKKLNKNPKIILVDGEMFSWYGSRLLKAAEYFCHMNEKMNM